jgi:hypothetical protein
LVGRREGGRSVGIEGLSAVRTPDVDSGSWGVGVDDGESWDGRIEERRLLRGGAWVWWLQWLELRFRWGRV